MLLDVREQQNCLDVAISLSNKLAQFAVKRDAKATIPEEAIEQLRESGLLPLVVPKKYGGIGATWSEALKVVQELSKADGSIGQLYGNHLTLTALAHVSGTPEQKERYYRETARNDSFWANAINTWDTRLRIISEGDNFRLNGVRSFDTVVAAADLRVFCAWQEGVQEPFFFVIPKDREGVISNQDWDNVGESKSDRGSFTFHNVLVKKDEILEPPNPTDSAFATFLGVVAQLTKTSVCLGIATGALNAVEESTKTLSQSCRSSDVDSATQDCDRLSQNNDLWIELKTATKLADQVADILQAAWEKELRLTSEDRGSLAIAIFSAEAFATRVSLNILNYLFELMKTRSTDTKNDFDCYCRDLQSFGGVSMPWKGEPHPWKLSNFSPQLAQW